MRFSGPRICKSKAVDKALDCFDRASGIADGKEHLIAAQAITIAARTAPSSLLLLGLLYVLTPPLSAERGPPGVIIELFEARIPKWRWRRGSSSPYFLGIAHGKGALGGTACNVQEVLRSFACT